MRILSDICEVYSGYALKEFNDDGDGLPVIKIGNIMTDGSLSLTDCQYTSEMVNDKYYSKKGDIYVALSGATTGKIGILESDGIHIINQRVGVVRRKNDNVPKEYIKYFLLRQTNRILKEAAGCAQPNISPKQIAAYEIPEIANDKMQEESYILDKLSFAIAQRKNELLQLDNLIKARFVELFGDTVINPMGWEEHRLDEYIDFLTSGSRGWAQYFVDEENELFITIKNVKNNHITLDNVQYIEAPKNKEAERTRVKAGDLLISITADLGRTGVVDDEIAEKGAYINQHLSLVRLDKTRINPLYVSYFLETQGGKIQFESKNQNGVKAGLNFDAIKSLKILVPPLDIQESYLDFVAQVDKSKVVVQKALEETQILFDSLMQEYFG